MEKEKAAFTKSVEITEKAIISRGKELKEFVDQCTWSLLEDLTTIKYDGLKAMEKCENEEFGSHILLYDRSETYRTDFKSTFSADGLLHDGFAQTKQPSKAPTQERIISIQISFEISKLEDFLKGNNIIGNIKREDKRVAVETADAEFGFHQEDDEENTAVGLITTESDQGIVDDEATAIENAFDADEKKADETIPNAEEYEKSVEDKEETPLPMKVEAEFPEKEKETKKETKTKKSKTKWQDRNKVGLQYVPKPLPLLCATYTYGDQQIPVARVRRRMQSISLIKTLELSRVWGVTKLDDSIYVLSWMPTSIRVYWDWDPFPLHDEIPIEGIQNPEDIASSAKTRCLYVSDTHDKCIWEITVADHQVTKWLSNVDWPFTLSVSSDGHLLLLRDTQNALEIYGSDARLIRSLRLPSATQKPLHAIQKPNGQFIIVHRLMDRKTGQWVISHLTNDGQLIGHFIPKPESLGLVDKPFHMALDSEDDRLFVADYWNHRVIRCDSLNWSETILKETIHRPLRLHYDVRKKQLIVANARRLDIYSEH